MNESLTWLYLPTAIALGALHALEPGHSKTLMASYLIGVKGTKRDAAILGISAAITHSLVVIGLSVAALWLGRETFTTDATHYLSVCSGWIVILLGIYLLWRRWPKKHGHSHLSEDAHARAHARQLPAYVQTGGHPTVWQIIAFGASGGMLPCPASITVMLLALSVGKPLIGLIAVLCFSLGLAIALVVIGMVVVVGINHISKSERFSWISARAPLFTSAVVIFSGIMALLLSHS